MKPVKHKAQDGAIDYEEDMNDKPSIPTLEQKTKKPQIITTMEKANKAPTSYLESKRAQELKVDNHEAVSDGPPTQAPIAMVLESCQVELSHISSMLNLIGGILHVKLMAMGDEQIDNISRSLVEVKEPHSQNIFNQADSLRFDVISIRMQASTILSHIQATL